MPSSLLARVWPMLRSDPFIHFLHNKSRMGPKFTANEAVFSTNRKLFYSIQFQLGKIWTKLRPLIHFLHNPSEITPKLLAYGAILSAHQKSRQIQHKLLSMSTRRPNKGANVFTVLTEDDFDQKVLRSEVPVIVQFTAEWCGPCQSFNPRIESKVDAQQGKILLAKVDVDEAGDLVLEYDISAVPTVLSFIDGNLVSRFNGILQDNQIEELIDELCCSTVAEESEL